MRLVEERRHFVVYGIFTEICSCKEYKEPREQREVVHRLKIGRPEAEREQQLCLIQKIGKLYSDSFARTEPAVHYSSCQQEKYGANSYSDWCRDFFEYTFPHAVYHHGYTHKVKYSEKYRCGRSEKRKYECYYHAYKKALDTSLCIVA